MLNAVESNKRGFGGAPYWKFFGKAWWITGKQGQLVYIRWRYLNWRTTGMFSSSIDGQNNSETSPCAEGMNQVPCCSCNTKEMVGLPSVTVKWILHRH